MTAHLAVESIARALPNEWRLVPFRRVAHERGVRNADLHEPSLSLSSTGALYKRTDETDRQFASEQSSRNAWVVHPGDLVVNPMWLFGGAIGVSDRRGAVSPDYPEVPAVRERV
jgi:type I restriction enzyme S subunit